MPVRVACPRCKAVHTLPGEHGGEVLRCRECRQAFRAPRPAAGPGPRPSAVTTAPGKAPWGGTGSPADSRRRAPDRRAADPEALAPRFPTALLVGGLVAALLLAGGVVLGGGYLAYSVFGKSPLLAAAQAPGAGPPAPQPVGNALRGVPLAPPPEDPAREALVGPESPAAPVIRPAPLSAEKT